jgi:hypothetical protein
MMRGSGSSLMIQSTSGLSRGRLEKPRRSGLLRVGNSGAAFIVSSVEANAVLVVVAGWRKSLLFRVAIS